MTRVNSPSFPGGSDSKKKWIFPIQGLGWKDPLKEGMGAHASIHTWRIPMDRRAWQATVHVAAESDTTETLSTI